MFVSETEILTLGWNFDHGNIKRSSKSETAPKNLKSNMINTNISQTAISEISLIDNIIFYENTAKYFDTSLSLYYFGKTIKKKRKKQTTTKY